MFVRFRETKSTLQPTLLVGRRVGGRVRHEQVAALGTIKLPLHIDAREAFCARLHQIMMRLGNRIPAEAQGKIMAQVHGRIPMVTVDERQAHEIALAEREQEMSTTIRDLLTDQAADLAALAVKTTASAAISRKAAADAGAAAADAGIRAERWRRGEAAPRGQEVDVEQALREVGMTDAELAHARVLGQLPREALPILRDISIKAGDAACRAAARRLLRAGIRRAD